MALGQRGKDHRPSQKLINETMGNKARMIFISGSHVHARTIRDASLENG